MPVTTWGGVNYEKLWNKISIHQNINNCPVLKYFLKSQHALQPKPLFAVSISLLKKNPSSKIDLVTSRAE